MVNISAVTGVLTNISVHVAKITNRCSGGPTDDNPFRGLNIMSCHEYYVDIESSVGSCFSR